MTAKHRKGKNNHKHEDNFFKNDIMESEVRAAGNNYAVALVLIIVVVIGGAIGAWFCFQQHQTLTYLTDNIMGIQMKIAKLQSSHEDLRQSNGKHISESLVSRLTALEESYSLAKKQVGMALATAEQLKTSDLPAQVLSLHTEMKTRMAEMQQATVSMEQLDQVQSLVLGKSEEFEGVRLKLEALVALSDGLSVKVEALESNLGAAESKLTEQVNSLSANLDGQAAEVLSLREQLEEASVRAEVDTDQAPEATENENVEEQLESALEDSLPAVEEDADTPQEQTTEEELTEEERLPLTDEVAPAETEAEEVTEEQPAAPEEPPVEEDAATEEASPTVEEVIETEAAENLEEDTNEELNIEAEEATPPEDSEKMNGLADAQEEDIPKEEDHVEEQPEEVLETVQETTAEEIQEATLEQTEDTPEEQEDSPAEDIHTVEEETALEAEETEIPEVPEHEEQAEPELQVEDIQDALEDK